MLINENANRAIEEMNSFIFSKDEVILRIKSKERYRIVSGILGKAEWFLTGEELWCAIEEYAERNHLEE